MPAVEKGMYTTKILNLPFAMRKFQVEIPAILEALDWRRDDSAPGFGSTSVIL